MLNIKKDIYELKDFIILWLTQALSGFGSGMTSFALIIWSYQNKGSALSTAMLSVCSYTPYVVMSIFAGALSDRWNKKVTMLVSDTFAAMCTLGVLILLAMGKLEIWHLYILNALNGLMNTVQKPASDVALTIIVDKKHYQRVSGLMVFSDSVKNILTPVIATAVLAFGGMRVVIIVDLVTFGVAFVALLFFVKIPEIKGVKSKKEGVIKSALGGIEYLKNNRGVLDLILFLAAINFTASVYSAALPAMLISKSGDNALGIFNTVTGLAMVVGSLIASAMPKPKSRIRVICNTLLISMSTENFILALGKSLPVWCFGAVLGWLSIPVMNTNMNVVMRSYIPVEIQGRVYSARNSLQFFTIPLGYLVGGFLVDKVFEPYMAMKSGILNTLFGVGKGSGACFLFFILGFVGVITCIVFRYDKNIWELDKKC